MSRSPQLRERCGRRGRKDLRARVCGGGLGDAVFWICHAIIVVNSLKLQSPSQDQANRQSPFQQEALIRYSRLKNVLKEDTKVRRGVLGRLGGGKEEF